MANSALQPVSQAVFKVLNVPALTAPPPVGAGGRKVTDDPSVDSSADFPFVWYELASETNVSSLGRGPWLMEIAVNVHAFSTYAGQSEAQRIIETVIDLLRSSALPVVGWTPWYLPHDRNVLLPFEQLSGIKVTELVTQFRLYVEEQDFP
jgi:hypothetical protein